MVRRSVPFCPPRNENAGGPSFDAAAGAREVVQSCQRQSSTFNPAASVTRSKKAASVTRWTISATSWSL